MLRVATSTQSHVTDPDMLGWTGSGPLPTADLEHIAFLLFGYRFPEQVYDDNLFHAERNDCRRLALQLRAKFQKIERWTLGTATDKLTEGLGRLVFGDGGPSPAEAAKLRAHAESTLQSLFAQFSGDQNVVAWPTDAADWTIPSGPGVDDRWRQSYVASKVADVLTELTCPGVPFRNLDVNDRAWLRGQTESLVEDTVARFGEVPGDPEYLPQNEPEYDFEGRTESEREL